MPEVFRLVPDRYLDLREPWWKAWEGPGKITYDPAEKCVTIPRRVAVELNEETRARRQASS